MNLSPMALLSLGRFSKMKTTEIQTNDVVDIARLIGLEIHPAEAGALAATIRSEDEDTLVAWIQQPSNVERLKAMLHEGKVRTPGNDGSVIQCPHCKGLVDLSQ